MKQSPRLSNEASQTTTERPNSVSLLLIGTAIDTTWRAFVPTIGGTFLGIAIDHWLNTAPVGVIVCLAVGAVVSGLLIAKQLRDVRKQR